MGEELLEPFEEIKTELELTSDDRLYFSPETGETESPEGYMDLEEGTAGMSRENPSTVEEVTLADPFAYVFTSGTTGLPKASIQTHRRWLTGQVWFGRVVMNLKPGDVHYCPLPFCLHVCWLFWGCPTASPYTLSSPSSLC